MHLLCPHCRNPIHLVDDRPDREEVCPSCGSSFRLDPESTVTGTPAGAHRLLGKFELRETVGSGAFTTVYKAWDTELERMVALKVPRAGNPEAGPDRGRFLREARSVAQLRHPGIVPVYEVGESDGTPFLVSDFVQGVTLSELLTGRRPTPREAAEILAAVAEALQAAHDQGVVHRDVKPSNIMIDKLGRPQLMDFGLAKRASAEITMTEGQVLGTPAYLSPEQARGEGHKVDGRSDIYSLGVILYQLLTGELPFRGATRMLLHQVLYDEPPPPRALNDRIPRDLETVCLKAMAKEPGRRYPTAGELAADLRRFLSGQPVRGRTVGRLEPGWRWCRRNPLVAALSAGVGLLLVATTAVTGISYWRVSGANRALASERNQLAEQAREAVRLQNLEAAAREKAQSESAAALSHLRRAFLYVKPAVRDFFCKDPTGAPCAVCKLKFSPDERWLASADAAAGLHLIDLHQPDYEPPVLKTGGTDLYAGLAFSPDGRQLWLETKTADKRRLGEVWELPSPMPARQEKDGARVLVRAAFTADNQRIGAGCDLKDERSKVWNFTTASVLFRLPPNEDVLALSENGGFAVTWNPRRPTAEVHDLAAPAEAFQVPLPPSKKDPRVALAEQAGIIALASERAIAVHNWQTGKQLGRIPNQPAEITAMAMDRRASVLVTLSKGVEDVRVWNPATAELLGTLAVPKEKVADLALSPSGRWLATGDSQGRVRLWDLAEMRGQLKQAGLDWSAPEITVTPLPAPGTAAALRESGERQQLAGRYRQAVEAYDRCLALDPKEGLAFRERAEALFQLGRYAASVADFEKARELLPESPESPHQAASLLSLGVEEASAGQWAQARTHFRQALVHQAEKDMSQPQRALVRLAAGDVTAYRRLCDKMIYDLPEKPQPDAANPVIWTAVLGPQSIADFHRLQELAEDGVDSHLKEWIYHNTLGAVLYRAGKYEAAIERLQQSLREAGGAGRPRDWLFLAMAYQQLGHTEEARQWLMKVPCSPAGGAPWNEELPEKLLLEEARGLIQSRK